MKIFELNDLFDLLAHDRLRALRNYGDRWGISYLSSDKESIAEIIDDDFDRLIAKWSELTDSFEFQN